MMRLDLRDVLREPGASFVRRFGVDLPTLGDMTLTSPVRGEVCVVNSRKYLVVSGAVQTTVELECSRCLCPFDYPVHARLEATCELRYFEDLLLGQPGEADEEITSIFDMTSMDLEELIRQAVLLELPIQPLHSPLCKGLCPGCGRDLNCEDCVCTPEESDPRWQQLAVLLEQQSKKEEK